MASLTGNQSQPRFSQMTVTWREIENIENNHTQVDHSLSMMDRSAAPQTNKKLEFDISDGYDEDDEEDQTESHHNIILPKAKQTAARSSEGSIRKRIDFGSSEDETQNEDRDPCPIGNLDFDSDSEVDSENVYHSKQRTIASSTLKSRGASPPGNILEANKNVYEHCSCVRTSPHQAMQSGDHIQSYDVVNPSIEYEIVPSPHRTRSGRIYTSGDSRLFATNIYCPICKPDTSSSISYHHMSPEHMTCPRQSSIKRPFNEESTQQIVSIENATQPLCSSENLHLNLLQSDIVNRKVAAKRSRRHSSGMSDYSNENNESNNMETISESSITASIHQEQPQFELPPPTLDAPPPLDYVKRPVSRLSLIREKMQQRKKEEQLRLRTDIKPDEKKAYNTYVNPLNRLKTPSFEGGEGLGSPGYMYQTPTNQHSPPINEVRAMRIFDSHSPKGNRAIPSHETAPKFRLPFESLDTTSADTKVSGHQRRKSAPSERFSPEVCSNRAIDDRAFSEQTTKLRKRTANINPFTPTPTLESIKRRKISGGSSMLQTPGDHSINGTSFSSCGNCSFVPNSANTSGGSSSLLSSVTAHDLSSGQGQTQMREDSFVALDGYIDVDIHKGASNADAHMTENKDQRSRTEFVFQPPDQNRLPSKRLRVSDINVSRYDEEFVEIEEIASGVFGKVMAARHRLDGMVYAIKITKKQIFGNTHQERVTMNEVFAHSALIKHKHVVRYYNSWVENGRVYIQNEFCEGGALGVRIDELRRENHNTNEKKRFPECELKKILLHAAKGLHYIHSKGLVHLDVKPENILITMEHTSNSPSPNTQDRCDMHERNAVPKHQVLERNNGIEKNVINGSHPQMQISNSANISSSRQRNRSGHDSTDSGHGSGCDASNILQQLTGVVNHIQCTGIHREPSSSPGSPETVECPYFNGADRVSYKIGDLGHVVPIRGDYNPEEGDCRYMAPELLSDEINRDHLTKSDIFSLGLAMYEAASLKILPKNSLEDPSYENIKSGDIPTVEGYSKEFNSLIKSMINPDPLLRPSANRLVTLVALRTNGANSKSRSQLYKELREAKGKLKLLEQELDNRKIGISSQKSAASPEFPTPPKDKETSEILISPITPASYPNMSNPSSREINKLDTCITRSKDNIKLVASANVSSVDSKETSSTPKRNDKRANLRKRALVGRSKLRSPGPVKKHVSRDA